VMGRRLRGFWGCLRRRGIKRCVAEMKIGTRIARGTTHTPNATYEIRFENHVGQTSRIIH
jgi:hypothetical protein